MAAADKTDAAQKNGSGENGSGEDYEVELGEVQATVRTEKGAAGRLIFYAAIGIGLWHIYTNTLSTWSELYIASVHFGVFAFVAALIYPMARAGTKAGERAILIGDFVIGLLALFCAAYIVIAEPLIHERGVELILPDWIIAFLSVAIVIELVRRTTGWLIPILIILSLTYVTVWGTWVGGVFNFPGLTWEILMFRSVFGGDGMFGPIARISYSFVFMFILFGAFLVRSGAGDFMIDLARSLVGKLVGGPGLVAVFGSGLMGSISGSAVANTVSTGVITIPLMKRAGYHPRFAAGVEAASSTGGQLMPPIMGAGAFIMANLTQIPYVEIIGYSVLPAILYFASVGFFVRVEAKRLNLPPDPDVPSIKQVLKEGWQNLIPLVVLVWLLISGFTPTYAAGLAILAVIASSWLGKNRMGPRAILEAMSSGVRNCASVAVLLVGVGLMVNVIATTGIGNTFSLMINNWAGGSLFITLILIALASLILGMGLPVTAAYVVLGTLSAPAIYNLMTEMRVVELMVSGQLPEQAAMMAGALFPDLAAQLTQPMSADQARDILSALPIDFQRTVIDMSLSPATLTAILLSAHLIIFWLSQDSNVTPPVCLCAFAAAAIAGSPAMRTGVTAWKIAKGLYIVPLLFAYTPFIGGPVEEVARIFLFAMFGLYAFAGAFQGYLEGPLNPVLRVALGGASAAMLWPHGSLVIDLAGLAVLIGLWIWSKRIPHPQERIQA
ncbi:MAG: TRAP transporter permease [Magnetovibrionaceae bacterium]